MASPRTRSFHYGSASSSYSVRDAIESYRRAQYLSVNANVASSSDQGSSHEDEDEDEEALAGDYDDEVFDEDDDRTPGPAIISALEWDVDAEDEPNREGTTGPYSHPGPGELLPSAVQPQVGSPITSILVPPGTSPSARPVAAAPGGSSERTPLLHKTVSFSKTPDQALHDRSTSAGQLKQRRMSTASARSDKYHHVGKSTFGQTLFNSIAVLLGIGMLSEPLAFAYAGWIGGTLLVIGCGWICCYTAKFLGRVVIEDPSLRSYADIGRKAFGPRSIPFISTMFCLELFAVSVALVTLGADSLHSIFPSHDSNTYKLWGLIVLIPTVFLPLSLLSYTSILGITSTIFIVFIILFDGFSKREGPGSLWQPAETSISFTNVGELGISFGLFMAGLSGHAIIPSITRDMIDPTQYEKMIDLAFLIASAIYAIIGGAGYLMFGHNVHDEVSLDLLLTPGYNATLNKIALWTFVISPLSKFALATRPVNITLEIMLGLEDKAPATAPDDHAAKPRTLSMHGHPDEGAAAARRLNLRRLGVIVERIMFTLLSVSVSIFVPGFSSMMAFIGSFAAFLICVIGPISAKIAIDRHCSVLDGSLLVLGIVMAIWGTAAAVWGASG